MAAGTQGPTNARPLLGGSAPEVVSSSPQPQYQAAPEQSTVRTMAVLMRKHLILGLRRKRFVGIVFRLGFTAGVPLIIWFTQEPGDRERIRGSLAGVVLPILGAIFIVAVFTQFVVEVITDKELKMRYVQQIAGVSSPAYWLSYYLFYLVMTTFATVLWLFCTAWLAPIYEHSDAFLMFLSFSAAFLQTFFTCMVVSTLISRARMAGVICSMMGSIVVAAHFALAPLVDTDNVVVYFAQSLIPFNAPASLLGAIGALEQPGGSWGQDPPGFTWSSFYTPIHVLNDQSGKVQTQPAAGVQFLILLANCAVYGIFASWFDEVHQGEFGAAKPLTFCFNPAYICPRRVELDAQAPALRLVNLVKTFGLHRAVDGMSLEVRRAEIFALLGHNGAGKTTVINCITGMLPMTSGSASVCGADVSSCLQQARQHLSVCPQDNPLYLEYSVTEHLEFFAALRGVPAAAAEMAIRDALEALGLVEKQRARVSTLSGGQKRRLWVATSLLGETPVVFLDEPTSGMDPANRRKLWDLLVRMKSLGRCVLFTTHYLDEADVLAERKAVLDKGKVKAVGTSAQLKRQFGLGYHLRVVGLPGTSWDAVAILVQSHISSATEESVREEDRAQARDAPTTRSFTLPYDRTESIGALLADLETRAPELQVSDFSVETTTLEEVFMALGQAGGDSSGMEQPQLQELPRSPQLASPQERLRATWLTSMQAVLALRWRQVLQKPRSLIATMVVPVGLLVLQSWLLTRQLNAIQGLPSSPAKNVAQGSSGAVAGLGMTVSLAIALPYFATSLVLDRVQRCLYVATSQGLRLSAYWVGTFLSNYLHFLMLAFMVPVLILVFQCPFFSEVGTFLKIVPSALLCPVPMLLFAYSASRLFSSTEACSKYMPSFSLLAALVPFLAVYILTILGLSLQIMAVGDHQDDAQVQQGRTLHKWANIVHWLMCFTDPFYLLPGTFAAIGLTQLTEFAENIARTRGIVIDVLFPSIGGNYVAVPVLCGLALSAALGFLAAWDASRSWAAISRALGREQQRAQPLEPLTEPQDADVLEEEQRVASAGPAQYAVTYKGLVHTYNRGTRREVRAVRGVSLGVPVGECFCLLGPNGAGKTTTLDVLTGAIFPPTQGEVRIGGYSTTSSREECYAALRLLGNCPQVDPLWPALTGRQHLLFYAKVKGLPPDSRWAQASAILCALGFSDFDADKPTQAYSGGMKRKLSLAIALIGSPPTLLLDEPSAAVDAAAKRHLWRVVKRRRPEQTVILTTHSMEEAEALSDRLAIQVRGRLRCLGTPDHIKMTHGAGYQLEVLSSESGVEAFVLALCPSARLMEAHEGRFLFQLPVLRAVGARDGELSLAALFLKMQEARQSVGLRDYSITRPSLEQVFLRLSREQEELEEEAAAAEV